MAIQTPHLTDSDRISRLEGQIMHLATKADVERLRADMMRMFLIAIGVNVAVVSAGIAFLRLTGTA